METLYKITDEKSMTKNSTKWGEGISHELPKVKSPELCTSQVLHAYTNPNLALLLNPIHGNYDPHQLWESQGEICVQDWGKVGCFSLKTIKELNLPVWYTDTKKRKKVQIMFAILCAEAVLKYYEDKYPQDERPKKAIDAAKEYLKNPSFKTAYAARAAADAAYAADAAAYAARAAAYAADAARAAADAARAAADADAEQGLDFGALADLAIKMIEKEK